MEAIDLAGIQINFAPPRPAGFANFLGAGQDLLFCGAGRGSPFSAGRGGAGWGGAHIPGISRVLTRRLTALGPKISVRNS